MPEKTTPDAKKVLQMIKEKDVKYVDLRFTDPRGKWQHLAHAVEPGEHGGSRTHMEPPTPVAARLPPPPQGLGQMHVLTGAGRTPYQDVPVLAGALRLGDQAPHEEQLEAATRGPAPAHPGVDDPRVVQHQEIPAPQMRR